MSGPTAWDTTWIWRGRIPPEGLYLHQGPEPAPEDVLLSTIKVVVGPGPDLESTYKVDLVGVDGRVWGSVVLLPGQETCTQEFLKSGVGVKGVIMVPCGSCLRVQMVQVGPYPEGNRFSPFDYVKVKVAFLCVGEEMIELLGGAGEGFLFEES